MQATLGAWVPYERNHHISRRRHWMRKRYRDSKAMNKKEVKTLTNQSCFIYQSGHSAMVMVVA